MRYFCAFSYIKDGKSFFGNVVYNSLIDPYENIDKFLDDVEEYVKLPKFILLNYKRVM